MTVLVCAAVGGVGFLGLLGWMARKNLEWARQAREAREARQRRAAAEADAAATARREAEAAQEARRAAARAEVAAMTADPERTLPLLARTDVPLHLQPKEQLIAVFRAAVQRKHKGRDEGHLLVTTRRVRFDGTTDWTRTFGSLAGWRVTATAVVFEQSNGDAVEILLDPADARNHPELVGWALEQAKGSR